MLHSIETMGDLVYLVLHGPQKESSTDHPHSSPPTLEYKRTPAFWHTLMAVGLFPIYALFPCMQHMHPIPKHSHTIRMLIQNRIIIIVMHEGMNLCERVRESCRHVAEQAHHVKICEEAIDAMSSKFKYTSFNDHQHHQLQADPEQELYFLFMLDSLNFCFWPLHGFEYHHLATNVKAYISKQHNIQQLINITPTEVQQIVFNKTDIPLLPERTSNLRELALVVTTVFDGSFVNVVKSAEKSAVKLLSILTKHFTNMQDHTIYKGKQIHLYKRAQILIGDIYGKFEGKGLGQFYDIDELTMFPDYRVPQILNHAGILKYTPQLQNIIEQRQEISAGTPMEVEIRACSVLAVEIMREHLQKQSERKVLAIQVDWFLWELGQNNLSTLPPHHRTLTIYY